MKRVFSLALGVLFFTILTSCNKSNESVERLWKSPAGIIMSESDIPNWKFLVDEFKSSLAKSDQKVRPRYYRSQDCSSPQIPCGLECVETTDRKKADCIEESACAPCMNCCDQMPG